MSLKYCLPIYLPITHSRFILLVLIFIYSIPVVISSITLPVEVVSMLSGVTLILLGYESWRHLNYKQYQSLSVDTSDNWTLHSALYVVPVRLIMPYSVGRYVFLLLKTEHNNMAMILIDCHNCQTMQAHRLRVYLRNN